MWVGGNTDAFSEKKFLGRARLVAVVFAVLYGLITLRLFYLQVLKGEELARMSENNRTQVIFLRAPRGEFFDSKGRLLVTNRPSWSVMYSPPEKMKEEQEQERIRRRLAPFMEPFSKKWLRRLDRAFETGQMVRLVEDVPNNVSFGMKEMGELVPGLRVVMEFRRGYQEGNVPGHLVGYLGEISEDELKEKAWSQRRQSDLIGKMGLERILDREVRGQDGGMLIEVDSIGRWKRIIRELSSQKGSDVQLTLDIDVQRAAEQGLLETPTKRGAAVAIDVKSGAILAWASAPSFDLRGSLAEGITDSGLPFFDRVHRGTYPPGSTFKIMTAIAGLENGAVNVTDKINCPGYLLLMDKQGKEKRYGCWKRHGPIDFWRAMAESCDTYFYLLGARTGPTEIANTAAEFGFGQLVQHVFPGERTGTLPNPAWKKSHGLGGWSTGDTYNMSIGQGFVTCTPLQMAVMMAGVAGRGKMMAPYVVEKIIGPDGVPSYQSSKTMLRQIVLKDATWEMIFKALRLVITNGTGGVGNSSYLDVWGKTGTAQNPHGADHAWFVAYGGYPNEAPSVAVCVFVENGGHGGSEAAPVAKKMLEIALPKRSS